LYQISPFSNSTLTFDRILIIIAIDLFFNFIYQFTFPFPIFPPTNFDFSSQFVLNSLEVP